MRIAFYGGSFNPPHYSHFLAASWALCTGEVDQVWFVPCFQHAFSKTLAPYAHRLAMCRMGATSLGPKVKVSTIEEELGGTNYTIDTIRQLQERHPDAQFRLLIGTDILAEKEQWKSFDQLCRLAPLLLVGRAPNSYQQSTNTITQESPAFVLPSVSSSEIRERFQLKLPVSHQIPPPILAYIHEHRLYRDDI